MGWLEELSKLENMTTAAASPQVLTAKSWPVKFRLINRDTVLPSQVKTLNPPGSFPDPAFYERQHTDCQETGSVRLIEDTEILYWQPCPKLPMQICA